MRILISYEEAYRVYGDALERALGGLRPEAEVVVCRHAGIGEQLEGFDPHLVISSRPNTGIQEGERHGTNSPPSRMKRPKPA
jgi:hypothetical protein